MSDKTTMRPWGTYTELLNDASCKVKSILVNPGQRISLQMHKHRIEHWTIVSGEGELELGWAPSSLKKRGMKAGSTCKIAKRQIHRITNTSSTEPLVFIEVQRGESFAEEDIVRYEDDYGRADELADLLRQFILDQQEPFADLATVIALKNGREE